MKLRSGLLGLTLTSALALGAASANAADIYRGEPPVSYKDTPVVAPVSSWAGFYLGGHLGAGFADETEITWDNGETEEGDDDAEFLGGVHVGYNFQRYGSPLVLGIEGDVSFADNIDYLASIRGRIGYATDRALFYVTGGVAFAEFSKDDFGVDFDDDTETGWVVGGGAEFKLAGNWSLGLEGLYYDFDDVDQDGAGYRNYEDDNSIWVARARLSYHFNQGLAPLDGYK